MKKKNIIKIVKSTNNSNRHSGFGLNYSIKLSAILGTKNLKKNKMLKFYSADKNIIYNSQSKAHLNLKHFENKLKTLNVNNNTYKGVRLKLKLPLRGQRTHTNAQTARKLNYKNNNE